MAAIRRVPLTDKLACLLAPRSYPREERRIEVRETHMSWVFLGDRCVYKLKKPVRQPYLDYRSLPQRRRMCEAEVRLNRRLADWVYVGLAALVLEADGELALRPSGAPVAAPVAEWLVQMRRLPDALMLDRAIGSRTVAAAAAGRAASHLADFFCRAQAVPRAPPAHMGRLQRRLTAQAAAIDEIEAPGLRAAPVLHRLLRFLDRQTGLIERRVAAGRLVEGHGDLRPEHVFLGEPAAIIDCIEFDRELRVVDPLDELAFLWMECDLLGGGSWGETFLQVYLHSSGDTAPEALVHFYMSARALMRMCLALGHLPDTREPQRWRHRAAQYLDAAHRYAERI